MRILSYTAFLAIVVVLAFLWAPTNDGIHPISQNATFLAGEGCIINYENGGSGITVVNLSDKNEFEEKILAVNVTRDLGQMRVELEACQRFDKIWKNNPPSDKRATHNHFVTTEGRLIQVQDQHSCSDKAGFVCPKVEHKCDGHYNFITVE